MQRSERYFDEESFEEVEEILRDIDADEEDCPYFPPEESTPPHY